MAPPAQLLLNSDRIKPPKSRPQFLVMGIVPEKRSFAKEMLSGFDSHFWGHSTGSPHCTDGQVAVRLHASGEEHAVS